MIEPIIIILNGCKGSGKDTIADSICEQYDVVHSRFKEPLYDICAAISGLEKETFIAMATDRNTKEVPAAELGGRSPRDFMIYVSEEVIKPNFGKDYFGQSAVSTIFDIVSDIQNDSFMKSLTPNKEYQFFIFSDGGFSKETIPLVEAFGRDKVKIIHLKRDGYDYDNDSRRYLYQYDFPEVLCPYYFTEVLNEEDKVQEAIDEIVSIMHSSVADLRNSNKEKNNV